MRLTPFLFAWMIGLIIGHAQNTVSPEYYKDSAMAQRAISSIEKANAAMGVTKVGKNGKPAKRKKNDPSLNTEFSDRTFSGGGGNFDKKLAGNHSYRLDKDLAPGGFATRSFLGIKNPWFGKKVAKTGAASLWSKTDVANADKKFAVDDADTREFYQADKKAAEKTDPIATRSTKVEPKFQGFIDKTMNQKNLTVEEVRELLNKSR
jgi:hypothetical protein